MKDEIGEALDRAEALEAAAAALLVAVKALNEASEKYGALDRAEARLQSSVGQLASAKAWLEREFNAAKVAA